MLRIKTAKAASRFVLFHCPNCDVSQFNSMLNAARPLRDNYCSGRSRLLLLERSRMAGAIEIVHAM
jgi:hypothetical protein